jgi:broad specificity phosphatase PhoE
MTYQLSGLISSEVTFDSRLIELNWGNLEAYEGIIPLRTPNIAKADRHNAWLWSDKERIEEVLREILDWHVGKVVLFGHWGLFNYFLLSFLETEPTKVHFRATMDNASISLLEVDENGDRLLRYWNDRSHVVDLLIREKGPQSQPGDRLET